MDLCIGFTRTKIYIYNYGIWKKVCQSLPRGHVWLWELDCKEGRTPKNWCLWTVVLEKTPESPLNSKEIKPVNFKGNQPWIFREEGQWKDWCWSWSSSSLVIWWEQITGRVPDAGKDQAQKKRASEDGWDGWTASLMRWTWTWAEFGRWWGTGKPGVLSPWGCKESDMSGWLNNDNIVCVTLKHVMKFIEFHLEEVCMYTYKHHLYQVSNVSLESHLYRRNKIEKMYSNNWYIFVSSNF